MASPGSVGVDQNLADSVNSLTVDDSVDTISKKSFAEDSHFSKWGFPLPELYRLSLMFYQEQEGKALHLSYQDKLRLVAYTKQVAHGKYRPDMSAEVGFLDVVGNDRRKTWQSLGDMSTDTAMIEFIKSLDKICTSYQPYIDAHKAEKDEKLKKEKEEEEQRKIKEEEAKKLVAEEEQVKKQQEVERKKRVEQEIQIRTALNQQTAIQFRQYAEQQYPGHKLKQEELILQLQEQHFQQYMQQVYQQQLLHQKQQFEHLQQNGPNSPQKLHSEKVNTTEMLPQVQNSISEPQDSVSQDGSENTNADSDGSSSRIPAANMWTRKEVKQFKDSLTNDKDSVIKIGSGETVTVRVPTHEDGACLFWEFATDYYDLGFGVYFEWNTNPGNTVNVQVSESSDEEEFDEEGGGTKADVEKGSEQPAPDNRPPTDEIIPVCRRDCHEEVYCGSHTYPGKGVYLLKFDNSYSLWRSKTLYYRVYYSK